MFSVAMARFLISTSVFSRVIFPMVSSVFMLPIIVTGKAGISGAVMVVVSFNGITFSLSELVRFRSIMSRAVKPSDVL